MTIKILVGSSIIAGMAIGWCIGLTVGYVITDHDYKQQDKKNLTGFNCEEYESNELKKHEEIIKKRHKI